MFDPTHSRYKYLSLKKSGAYRRFVQDEKQLQAPVMTATDLAIPTHGTYGALLFDPKWRHRRTEILLRDAEACTICKSTDTLQIHHRQYQFVVRQNKFKLPWEYPDYLLITLCESCHKRGHSKYKVPIIKI